MTYQVSLPLFEGPLDLLLRLIQERRLDVTAISVAAVADQYLAHVVELERVQIDDLAQFLVIAARLLLIKSQALLPRPPVPVAEDDPAQELAQQLLAYQKIKDAVAVLRETELRGWRSFPRGMVVPPPPGPPPLGSGKPSDLVRAWRRIRLLTREVAATAAAPVYALADMMAVIEQLLRRRLPVRFSALTARANWPLETVVLFLAVLELVRRNRAEAEQSELFGEITILPPPGVTVER